MGDVSDRDRIPVTVVVPIRNEAVNLAACLSRLGRFAVVIVADSGSSDGSQEIARAHGATLLHFAWNGRYPKKRNWVLLNHLADGWVLFLDADERVDDQFCDEVAKAIASSTHDGYWLNYTTYFLGRRLRYGVPQRKLALFKAGCGLYEDVGEEDWSSLDVEVHEHPVLRGSTGEIAAPIAHEDHRGLEAFLERHRDYARWEARRFLRLQRHGGVHRSPHLTHRQRIKYRYMASWWYPWAYFAYAYIGRLGCRDGGAGFHYAFYKAWYFNTTRLLIGELRRSRAPLRFRQ